MFGRATITLGLAHILVRTVLCCVVYDTHEQFLQMSVGLCLVFCAFV